MQIFEYTHLAGLSQAGGLKSSQFLADQLTLSGGHIIPTQYYVPSRAVRPCDGLGSYKFWTSDWLFVQVPKLKTFFLYLLILNKIFWYNLKTEL